MHAVPARRTAVFCPETTVMPQSTSFYTCRRHFSGYNAGVFFIDISLRRQELTLREGSFAGSIVMNAPISSGRNGIGFEEGSGKTPTGRFEIGECIGKGYSPYTIFCSRQPVGEWPHCLPPNAAPNADFIIGRILRLRGLDADNANTWERYIYIHGTHDLASLGNPTSHGCIRVGPDAIVSLFNRCPVGTPVRINAS